MARPLALPLLALLLAQSSACLLFAERAPCFDDDDCAAAEKCAAPACVPRDNPPAGEGEGEGEREGEGEGERDIVPDALIVDDIYFAPAGASPGNLVVHRYATEARIDLTVRIARGLDGLAVADGVELIEVTGSLTEIAPDPNLFSPPFTDEPDSFRVALRSAGAGVGGLVFEDDDGNRYERELTVAAPAPVELTVSVPDAPGVTFPAVDPGRVRVVIGRDANFRATPRDAGGLELLGSESLVPSLPVASTTVTVAARRACAPFESACFFFKRNSVLVTVTGDAAAESDTAVDVRNGASLVTTFTARATALDAIAPGFSIVPASVAGLADGAASGAFVPLVTAAGEPVFGAPVSWRIDNNPEPGVGDAIGFRYQAGGALTLVASVDGSDSAPQVVQGDLSQGVSTITVTCGALSSTTPSLFAFALALALAFVLVTRRRRVSAT